MVSWRRWALLTQIIVKRREVVTVDGVPQYGDLAPWQTFDAKVAPSNPAESNPVGRNAVISGYTVFVETGAPTGILDSDTVNVAGTDYEVDGKVASWTDEWTGEYIGDQFALKTAVG